MMEVEEVHGFRDADMIPEESSAAWDDQMMQDDHHHQPIPEVEMANEFPDDDIEYDMEDASGHLEFPDEPVISPTEAVEVTDQVQTIPTVASILPQPSSTPLPPLPPPATTDYVSNDNITESKPPEEPPAGSSTEAPVVVESDTRPANDDQGNDQPESAPVDASRASELTPPNGHISSPKTALAGRLASPPASQAETRADGEPDRSEPHEAVVNSDAAQEETEEATDPLPEPNKESLEPVDESATELYPSSVLVLSPSSPTLASFYLFAPPDDSSSEEVVYFADQAQLFYEPLHAVFEALRALADDLGIMDHVELALCSEALDLNVSEDNVFSREVSLNDLNTLHIGCELEGSLALRLDQNSPRFITRYRAIMAELHRVSSVQDAEQDADAGELPVPRDDKQNADQTEQDQEGNDEHPAAETELQNNGAGEDDQASGDPNQHDPSTVSATAEAISRPKSHLTDNAASDKNAPQERPSPQTSRKTPLNTMGDTSLGQEGNYARPAEDSKEDGQLAARDVPKSSEVANSGASTGHLRDTTVGHRAKEVATSSKRADDIDSPSAVANEGIPPYRVTFDVSDQEEGEVGDTTSLLGDETQTTRFESQITGPSFMFNTQDGVDVPYHPDMYLHDNDDDADAYAADLERGYATTLHPSKTFESSRDYTRTDENGLGEYDDADAEPSSNVFKSPASELWDDEPDELLFYEAEDGEPNGVERAGSEEGENSQEPKDPQEYDQYAEHDEVAISYEDDVIDPTAETVPVLTSRTELPPVETKPSSPIRSWSTHSSKRSFNDDDMENGADHLGRKAEAKRAKIQ